MKKAVFLDRDGVINRERGEYTWRPEDFEILPDVIPALKKLQENDFLLIVITNQGGIARGFYSEEDFQLVNEIMLKEFRSNGIHITEVYYCPHYPDQSKCICRKPDSLLLEKAIARFDIDTSLSWMIGDKQRDTDAALKAGLKSLQVAPNSSLLLILDKIIPSEK